MAILNKVWCSWLRGFEVSRSGFRGNPGKCWVNQSRNGLCRRPENIKSGNSQIERSKLRTKNDLPVATHRRLDLVCPVLSSLCALSISGQIRFGACLFWEGDILIQKVLSVHSIIFGYLSLRLASYGMIASHIYAKNGGR